MITVRDLFQLTIDMDMKKLAYYIFWAMKKRFVSLEDDSTLLDAIPYNLVEIGLLTEANPLQIGIFSLYVVETGQQNIYAFYYARSHQEAESYHTHRFREQAGKTHFTPHLMGKAFFIEKEESEILYFHRQQVVEFPYYLGHAEAQTRILWKEH